MQVEYRIPSLPKMKIDRASLCSTASRIFKDISSDQIIDLWDIVLETTKQKKGAILVVSDAAEQEAERLGKQSFELKPMKINNQLVKKLTAIDGAVLLNRDSICYAIGVILDGVACQKGDSSRGARYNSAVRYYEFRKTIEPLMLIVVSEDGMINLIPDLMPKVKHSEIETNIEELLAINKQEKIDYKAYYKCMNFLVENEFYLTSTECEKINAARKEIDAKRKNESMRIIYRDFHPNSEMNDSYYEQG